MGFDVNIESLFMHVFQIMIAYIIIDLFALSFTYTTQQKFYYVKNNYNACNFE